MPYIVMAVILVLLGLLLRYVHLPEVDTEAEDEAVGEANLKKTSVWQFPHMVLGVVALFFYVGVEVIAGDTIIRYGQSLGIPMDSAKYFTSLTMVGMIIGYLLGILLIPKYLKQGNALKICTILGVIFSLGAIFTPADKVFTMPFIDLVTFQRGRAYLSHFVRCFWHCQFPCLACNVAAGSRWCWKIQRRFCDADNGNCRRGNPAIAYKTGCVFQPRRY
jgi:fucose permease